MTISCCTKYKPNLGHKVIYNYTIPYLRIVMINDHKSFKNPENEQIKSWPKRNSITLYKMMINIWNKWEIDLGYREDQ